MGFQTLLHVVFPPRCLRCGEMVESDFGLCGACWRDTPFIGGMVCDLCGTPLPGDDPDEVAQCDDCMAVARPWSRGRAALLYQGNARKLVLALKHGDRHEIARPAGLWLAKAARPMLRPDTLIAPVPLHWSRMLRRRFNQSALLARSMARHTGAQCCPDLLVRRRFTPSLEGKGRDARFVTLADAIVPHPGRIETMQGRPVLLVDDVMTSGATLAASAEACLGAGAAWVDVVVLARASRQR